MSRYPPSAPRQNLILVQNDHLEQTKDLFKVYFEILYKKNSLSYFIFYLFILKKNFQNMISNNLKREKNRRTTLDSNMKT